MKTYKYFTLLSFVLALSLFVSSCSEKTEPVPQDDVKVLAPSHFPPVPFPDDNPYNPAKAELGRYLFYDPIISPDGSIASCSHCKPQASAYAINVDLPAGYQKQLCGRNVMPMINLAYKTEITWDGHCESIEDDTYGTLASFIFGADTNGINKRLKEHSEYPEMFIKAFGEGTVPSTFLASQAISTFVRTLISGNSPYDKYINGNKSALNESEIRGMELFFSDRTSCSECHSGLMFTDEEYHNTGTTSHYFDKGRYNVTGDWQDKGKFLTPTLRNVELTYPYLHTGEYWTLEELIHNYNIGGHEWFNKDTLIRPLNLNATERADLVNFLKSLTDTEFITNKKHSNPIVK